MPSAARRRTESLASRRASRVSTSSIAMPRVKGIIGQIRAAELHYEALFKDPPAKGDSPICFLPMTMQLISCVSLPPAKIISSVPIKDFCELTYVHMAEEDICNYVIHVLWEECLRSVRALLHNDWKLSKVSIL